MCNVTARVGIAALLATTAMKEQPAPPALAPVEIPSAHPSIDVTATRAVAINNRGQVILEGADEHGRVLRSWLWENGTMADLGAWDASGVNDSGQVVGTMAGDRGLRAAVWENGTLRDLHPGGPPGYTSAAVAINDQGDIAGYATLREGTHYCPCDQFLLWSSGAPRPIGVFPGDNTARATAINSQGAITGVSTDYDPATRVRAVIWNGEWTELPALTSDGASQATGVNDRGQIVGWSEDASRAPRAVLWSNGTVQDLGILGHATAINEGGMIVGWREHRGEDAPRRRAFVWDGGTAFELAPLPGLRHSHANAINDLGDIVGYSASEASGAGARATLWPARKRADGR